MAGGVSSFVVDVLFEGEHCSEVLQLPILRPNTRNVRRALGSGEGIITAAPPRPVPILGSGALPSTDDTLEQFLQQAGTLFGKDPAHWERIGEPTTDVSEQDGRRIIKRTGMYRGTQLHLFRLFQLHDPRLPLRPEQPELEFALQRQEIESTEQWQQLLAEQPLTASRRRQAALGFLQAKLEADDEQLQLEGAKGLWELSINKPHHAELELRHLRPLAQHLQSPNVEVSRVCTAVVWGLAVSERSRALLLELGTVQVLLSVARRSLVMQCMGDSEALPGDYVAAGRCSQTQRDQLQACVLGALSVMIIDRACREPLIEAEPSCGTLFELCSNLPGYEDRAWAAARREAAAKALTSLVQRDHDGRMQLVLMGGLTNILGLLDSKGPGHGRVQLSMASLLATLVLDDDAMELVRQRGEGHLMFEATLKLLSHTLASLKFTLAVPGSQILAEGMTQAEVHAAMQQLRSSGGGAEPGPHSSTGGGVPATPLMQVAARRLSQEAAVSSSGEAAAARRLSADASAAAALLVEASHMSRLSASGQQQEQLDPPEPLDVGVAVSLAEACAQAMWGSAHYSLEEPLHMTPGDVHTLGKLALDCLIISELDLGRVCHCIAATLASLAGNGTVATFMMDAPCDSVAKAVLALLEVEDEPGFSNAGHVRAAASTCLAFLSCHPVGAKGDTCLAGPYRERLLRVGTLGALLRAALASSADCACNNIIQQTAAVGIMFLTTMAGAVDPAELAMYAALMTSNTNVQMVEFLMAGCWLLLKNPKNRHVLGSAFTANPAASKLTQGMMQKLQDTVDVANVNEAAETAMKARPPGSPGIYKRHSKRLQPSGSGATFLAASAAGGGPGTSAPPAARGAEPDEAGDKPRHRFLLPSDDNTGSDAASQAVPTRHASGSVSSRRLLGEASTSFDALALEADSMEDKLKLVETKRRSVLFSSLAGGAAAEVPEAEPGSAAATERVRELQATMQEEGPDSKQTLERFKSIGSRSLNRSLTNLDKQLGSELDENWGLDILVRVGESWLPKLLAQDGIPRGQSGTGSSEAETREAEAKADVPLLKVFEFLAASLCLYVIEEEPKGSPLRQKAHVYSSTHPAGADWAPAWWTVDAPVMQHEAPLSPLLMRTMHILLSMLQLRLPAAWKSMQLSVVMLWNAAVRSGAVESHQVREGTATLLLELVNSPLWPPTLRDMAAGHLQFLMETHANLAQLGHEWQQGRARQQQQDSAATAGGGQRGARATGSPSVLPLSGGASGASLGAHVETAAAASGPGRAGSPLPFDLAALLNPTVAAKQGAGARQQQPPADPALETLKAAGSHPGLVPALSCFVGLMGTGHQLLELCGARGIARMCFAAALGAPSVSQLLTETKAAAAAAGAIGSLVDLLRSTATKFMILEDGGELPPPLVLTHLMDKDYKIYERDINNREGVLELMTAVLSALLNLSTLLSNQPKLAKRGLMVLLKTNASLFEVISCRESPSDVEMRLLNMLAAILQNLASHPANRTCLYRAELSGTTALDRALEGPSSPEPSTSAALLATRLTLKATGSSSKQQDSRCRSPQRCESPVLGSSGRAAASTASTLCTSVDTALSAGVLLRPKVLFPPISRSTAGMLARSGGREQWTRAGSPDGLGPPASPGAPGGTANRGLPSRRGCGSIAVGGARGPAARSRSLKSRAATSVAGAPGTAMAAPDSREQFLIWMDSTFADFGGVEGGAAAEPWFRAP